MEKKYTSMLVVPDGSRRRRRQINALKNSKPAQQVIPPASTPSAKPPIVPVQSEGYIHAKRFDCL